MTNNAQPLLLGNTFPLSLIRRSVHITPSSREELLHALENRPIVSFWGHTNTLATAIAWIGHDLTPGTSRPALTLSPNQLPMLDGVEFCECFVLSPDYQPGFRPPIGSEVPPESIIGWQILHLLWS